MYNALQSKILKRMHTESSELRTRLGTDWISGTSYSSTVMDIPSINTAYTNVFSNLEQIFVDKVVLGNHLMVNDWKKMLQPPKKCCTNERLCAQVLETGVLVLHVFVGTLFSVKACQMLDNRRRFVGRDEGRDDVKKAMAGLAEVYVSELQNDNYDSKVRKQLIESARCSHWWGIPKVESIAGWLIAPRGLTSVQKFQLSVVSFLGLLHWDYSALKNQAWHLLRTTRSENLRSR